MNPMTALVRVLVADDDLDDCALLQDAISDSGLRCELMFVHDGEELMKYLHTGFLNQGENRCPALILLDLNMPLKDGEEVLLELDATPQFRAIPLVILTTLGNPPCHLQNHVRITACLEKPASYDALVEIVRNLPGYWNSEATWGKHKND